ncbi:GAF domain-like protein [Limtongia smithiae]|uniref:GAF domain-like protein n=1 Tax=Limtongia smithiae TaxID=1125753 RepID=UPI0034CFE760
MTSTPPAVGSAAHDKDPDNAASTSAAASVTAKHHADNADFTSVSTSTPAIYAQALDAARALFESQTFWPTNLANAASLLWYALAAADKHVNWTGFYVNSPERPEEFLLLGPFMGKVACQTICIGQGVCGTAAAARVTQVVPDVERFPGHIACDGETKSEVVVPLIDRNDLVRGVLDVDCTVLNGFDAEDVLFLEQFAHLLTRSCDW